MTLSSFRLGASWVVGKAGAEGLAVLPVEQASWKSRRRSLAIVARASIVVLPVHHEQKAWQCCQWKRRLIGKQPQFYHQQWLWAHSGLELPELGKEKAWQCCQLNKPVKGEAGEEALALLQVHH
jgi:hypothetical protein